MSEFLLIAATDVRQFRPNLQGSSSVFYVADLSLPERAANLGVSSATGFFDFFSMRWKPFLSLRGPAQRLTPSRRRFTLTRRTVDKHDSIGLVVAGFRRDTAPIPKRCAVSALDDADSNVFPLQRDSIHQV